MKPNIVQYYAKPKVKALPVIRLLACWIVDSSCWRSFIVIVKSKLYHRGSPVRVGMPHIFAWKIRLAATPAGRALRTLHRSSFFEGCNSQCPSLLASICTIQHDPNVLVRLLLQTGAVVALPDAARAAGDGHHQQAAAAHCGQSARTRQLLSHCRDCHWRHYHSHTVTVIQ